MSLEVYTCVVTVYNKSYLQLQLSYKDICTLLSVVVFKSRLSKMAATVMTAEFGTVHYYNSSLKEYSETCFCAVLWTDTKMN